MSLAKFTEILKEQGCSVKITASTIEIDLAQYKVWVKVAEDWKKALNGFFRARQYKFFPEQRILRANKFSEFQVIRIDPSFAPRPNFEFTNKKGDKVTIQQASKQFILSFYCSEVYKKEFFIIERRLKRRTENGRRNEDGRVRVRFEDLLLIPNTATYWPKKKLSKEKIVSEGRINIKGSLFNLAYSFDECWEIKDEIKAKPLGYYEKNEDESLEIPSVKYNDNLVSYYKVAKASQFPGQSFLSFYHILEYYFLRVADEELFNALKSQLNRPNFRATYDNVNKLLSTAKKHDNTNDETEMLKAVLRKYVSEDDLIEFIKKLERKIEKNIFTDKNGTIFGEKMFVKLVPGHALSNAAKIVKHIRNSLVHSSNRHNRSDCFMPFSETESVVLQYIPIVKFLAERVLFATAT